MMGIENLVKQLKVNICSFLQRLWKDNKKTQSKFLASSQNYKIRVFAPLCLSLWL